MAISDHYKHNWQNSSNDSDYRAAFHRDALCLIVQGHEMLVSSREDYSCEEEPAITGELVRCVRAYLEDSDAAEWSERYTVHDDPPEHDSVRKGTRRKKFDLGIECVCWGKRPYMRFEAKRLKEGGFSVDKYLGAGGLGEFIKGNYARKDDTCGMLGYMQSDDCGYWGKEICTAIDKKKNEVCLVKEGQWEKASIDNVANCYKTRHNRPTVNRELLVYHLLLDFTE